MSHVLLSTQFLSKQADDDFAHVDGDDDKIDCCPYLGCYHVAGTFRNADI